jgi:subtilisin family serine protease
MAVPRWKLLFNLFILLSAAAAFWDLRSALASPSPEEKLTASLPAAQDPFSKIEPLIFEQLAEKGRADFFIWLPQKADLSDAAGLNTRAEKGEFVFNALSSTAESSQKNVRAFLDGEKADYQPFFIANKILVRQANEKLLLNLANRSDIHKITANHEIRLQEPVSREPASELLTTPASNISFILADAVWGIGITGQGIVLAGNDTGLAWDHPAILSNYRGCQDPPFCTVIDHNYNWFDAFGNSPWIPFDNHGHGTHTTGTMVADDFGVAPGASTVHCRNMDDWGYGYDSTFTACFQWDLAPTDLNGMNPRPDLAPDAINNSWGYWGGGYPSFEDEIAALHAAGILVEVSAGNDGPYCSTLRSPGDYALVLTTGSVSHFSGMLPGELTYWSSRGPSLLYPGETVPDIMAPGESIYSAVPGGYAHWSGTSMAGPHTTGLIALLWDANPALRGMVPETIELIRMTAVPLSGSTGSYCGGDYFTGPNHDWGSGTINALAAVEIALDLGGAGTLGGTVYDAVSLAPLPAVTVQAAGSGYQRTTQTGSSGEYQMQLFSGEYTLTASRFGYLPQTASAVIVTDTLTTQDFYLQQAPSHTISGTVMDDLTGWPLYASISFPGLPIGPVWTDPVTGSYTVDLPEGSAYTVEVYAWVNGYYVINQSIGPIYGSQTIDFALSPDLIACSAPGYAYPVPYQEDFEENDGGFQAVNTYGSDWEWGIPLTWPGSCASGSRCWGTNLDGYYGSDRYDTLYSPIIDVSAYAGSQLPLKISWQQAVNLYYYGDFVYAEVSLNGGYFQPMGYFYNNYESWTEHTFTFYPAGIQTVQLRFILTSDYYGTSDGYYIDNIRISAPCAPQSGGLVVGIVYDNSTLEPLPGARVAHESGSWVEALPTPLDPGVDDAFYTIFAPSGTQVFTATRTYYSPASAAVDVISGSAVEQDFFLGIGHLIVSPLTIDSTLDLGQAETITLTLLNDGTGAVAFKIREQDLGAVIPGGEALTSGPISVLLLHTDYIEPPLKQFLEEDWEIGLVDTFNASSELPSLEFLEQYDVVIAWRYASILDSAELGSRLADYIDQGGKVIQAVYSWGYPSVDLGGRFVQEGYSPFTTLYSGNHNSYADLGAYDPNHPLMTGVSEVSDWRRDILTLSDGAELIASWSDGEEFVAVKENVVAINAYPSPLSGWDGDLPLIFRNAVHYLRSVFDVIWLSEEPVEGYLEPGESIDIPVAINAGGVEQPGEYRANLWVLSQTLVDPSIRVPVTMTVNIPPDWGRIEGSVISLGYCDENPVPLRKAQVVIESSTGQTWTAYTSETGFFRWWADPAGSPYTITAAASYHQQTTLEDLWLSPGSVAPADLSLRSLQPCLSSAPASLQVVLQLGQQQAEILTLDNSGAGEALFTIHERDRGFTAAEDLTGSISGLISTLPSFKERADDPLSALVLYSGCSSYYLQNVLNASPYIGVVDSFFAYSQVPSLDYLLQYDVVFSWSSNGYYSPDALGNVLADYLDAGGTLVQTAYSWREQIYLPGGRFLSGEYSPFITLNLGSSSSPAYLGSYDPTHPIFDGVYTAATSRRDIAVLDPQGEWVASWHDGLPFVALKNNVAAVNADPQGGPYPYPLPAADSGVDHIFVNAARFLASLREILWLSEEPQAGTVPPDSTEDVTLLFDAAAVNQPGSYFGSLQVKSNDQSSPTTIPITLTVTVPETWGKIEGYISTPGYCESDPAPLAGAKIYIESAGGQTWTTRAGPDGFYRWWADSAGSPYLVTTEKSGYEPQQAYVTVIPHAAADQPFVLRLLQPCLSSAPDSIHLSMEIGQNQTVPLTLTNQGAAEALFRLVERNRGGVLSGENSPPGAEYLSALAEYLPSVTQPLAGDPISVLLLVAGYDYSLLLETLMASPDIGMVDFYPANYATPPLDLLLGYDVVITWRYYSYNDPTLLGDVLADYIDQGGTLVQAGGSWAYAWGELGGRFAQGSYSPFLSQAWGSQYGQAWMGEYTLDHPIMEGVFTAGSHVRDYALITSGAERVAAWADGMEFVAVKDSVVAINAYPAPSSWQGDAGSIFTNAVRFLAALRDIPWLTAQPDCGSIPKDSAQVVDLLFDAGEVDQPGEYYGTLKVNSNDPYSPSSSLPVTLTVSTPLSWGKVEGMITGLGLCDQGVPQPLPGAQIIITSASGAMFTTRANHEGFFRWWADSFDSPYTVTVSRDGYVPQEYSAIQIPAQSTLLLDITLRLDKPCMDIDADGVYVYLYPGQSSTVPLVIGNSGAGEAEFSIHEIGPPSSRIIQPQPDVLLLHTDYRMEPLYSNLLAHPDIGEVEAYFTLYSYPTLDYLLQFDVVIFWQYYQYMDIDALGNLLADYLDNGGKLILAGTNWNYSQHELGGRFKQQGFNPLVSLDWDSNYSFAILGEYDAGHPIMDEVFEVHDNGRAYVSLQNGALLVASWIDGEEFIAVKGSVAAFNTYANSPYGWNLSLGQIYINTILYLTQQDVPWLSADPASGLIPGDSSLAVSVTLDASDITAPGVYEAALSISFRASNQILQLPIQMVVGEHSRAVQLTPESADGFADAGQAVTYAMTLTNLGSLPDSFNLTAAGSWSASLPSQTGTLAPGESFSFDVVVSIPAAAAPGTQDILTLRAASQTEPTAAAAAQLTTHVKDIFGVLVAPGDLTKTGRPGELVSFSLGLTNTGSAADSYHVALSGGEWETTLSNSDFNLQPGGVKNLGLTVLIPLSVPRGAADSVMVSITSAGMEYPIAPVIFTTLAVFDYETFLPLTWR